MPQSPPGSWTPPTSPPLSPLRPVAGTAVLYVRVHNQICMAAPAIGRPADRAMIRRLTANFVADRPLGHILADSGITRWAHFCLIPHNIYAPRSGSSPGAVEAVWRGGGRGTGREQTGAYDRPHGVPVDHAGLPGHPAQPPSLRRGVAAQRALREALRQQSTQRPRTRPRA